MKNVKSNLKPTIGLEVHCELRTNSKLFCGCPADHFGKAPNTQTCPVCLGLPGELPVTNKKAVDWTVLLGLALGSKINKEAKFDRKHYFYPDLPMGFQISQYDEPFCLGGEIETSEGKVNLTRVHLEIDTGKLQHTTLNREDVSLIDFNRSGVALMEIVTEPEIHTGTQAKEFAKNLQQIIRYLGISDCDMEKGSMRLEANISWGLDLGYKVEVKNLNSFRFLEKAINYELNRQKKALDSGEKLLQETRGWSETKQKTFSQRTKETAEDYRYFPDPDLPPFAFEDDYIEDLRTSLPELPSHKKDRFVREFSLPQNYAQYLTQDKALSEFYEDTFKLSVKKNISPKVVANLIVNKGLTGKTPLEIVDTVRKMTIRNFSSSEEMDNALNKVLNEQGKAVDEYKSGKLQVIGFLIGMVQKKLGGKGEIQKIKEKLMNALR
jgi:aspartyl-tRNA(Asn)/glutamyl-tRNA(Gln) amidotransferase subunit B